MDIVCVSDLHAGDRFSLCPATVGLDEGAVYQASELQQKIWAYWVSFWSQISKRSDGFFVILNGDVLQGNWGKFNHLITKSMTKQAEIARTALLTARDITGDRWKGTFIVNGTEVHAGSFSDYEKALAAQMHDFNVIPDENGALTHPYLKLRWEGKILNAAHHFSVQMSTNATTLLQREWTLCAEQASRGGEEAPDVLIRSHSHTYGQVRFAGKDSEVVALKTPCWQAKYGYVYKTLSGRNTIPEYGGVLIRPDDLSVEAIYWKTAQTKIIDLPLK